MTHSAKETRQQNEQWGWGWKQHGRGVVGQNLKKAGVGNIGDLHIIEGDLGPLCQLSSCAVHNRIIFAFAYDVNISISNNSSPFSII